VAGPHRLAFGFLLGLVFWAVVLFGLFAATTFSYELEGFRWTKLDPGYSADASVIGYTTVGMLQWSSVSGLRPSPGGNDIKVVVATLLPPITYVGQSAQANVVSSGGKIERCEVRLDPVYFFALNEQARQNTVTHELGHCIGLDHSALPSLMKNPLFYKFSDDDAAAAASLYGAPQQATKPLKELATGWNLVSWPETALPDSCACKMVYAAHGPDWAKWIKDAPGWVNTLDSLDAGQPYWVQK
jgi:hypothetical protein